MAKKQEEIERERIKVLQEYQILDTPEEKIFDDLAKLRLSFVKFLMPLSR
jgi:hypothetical protein